MSLNQLERELSQHSHKEQGKKKSVLKWVLIFFIICFSIIILGGGFLIWTLLFQESGSVDISIQVDKSIMRGIPFESVIMISNEQDIAISDAKLSLILPDGVREASTGGTLISEPLGVVQGGTSVKRSFSLISVNEKGTTKDIEARVSYIGGNNNRFEPNGTKATIEVTSEPLTVAVSLPDNIVRGSPFSFEIQYANKSNVDMRDILILAEYPNTFHFDRASVDPDRLNNRWHIVSLKKDTIDSIEVTGTYEGDESVPLTIPISLALSLGDRDYIIASSKSSKDAQPSPVTLDILVNGTKNYIAKAGDTLNYSIQYENRTGTALKNVEISLALSGEMVDFQSLSGGIINKRDMSINWNSANTPVLELLSAGGKGELSATVKVKEIYPIKKANDKNFSIVGRVKLESPTVPSYLHTLRTTASANMETKIGGYLGVASELRYRDPESGMVNSGPFPPKVGQATEYTVHWVLETGATDIKDVEISSVLEHGVQFAGVSKSNIETKPEYDSTSNTIKWKIPRILSGRGVVSDIIQATFQVRATPSQDQAKQFMPIMKETIARGTDEFTEIELVSRDVALSTSLPDDPTVGAGGGRVVQ
ncbi:hypothetical protein C4565_06495 [Candidatus Parcubacteria bacterium]|jgi:hypothetical protein|nr:MAG: hypothetical protein C4565_06495 [Candidatus Parcubacteria bacterium]